MRLSLEPSDLCAYVTEQTRWHFPDRSPLVPADIRPAIDEALDHLEYCFAKVKSARYRDSEGPCFHHLYSDQYVMFLWWLSRVLYERDGSPIAMDKIYYLNKTLHGFDSIYSNSLPARFLIIHGVGTVLGKASYSDYLVVHQGCTVGQNRHEYPRLGIGVGMGAGAAILGAATIGENVSIGAGVTLVGKEIPHGCAVVRNASGGMVMRPTASSISRDYFEF